MSTTLCQWIGGKQVGQIISATYNLPFYLWESWLGGSPLKAYNTEGKKTKLKPLLLSTFTAMVMESILEQPKLFASKGWLGLACLWQ